MKRSNRLVILVGVLLAVLAFVGIVVILNQPGTTPGEDGPEAARETVLVATQDIEIGQQVTPDMVEAREIDPEAVAGTPLRDPSQLGGRPSLFFVPADSQVNQETFGLNLGVEDIAGQLELGEKAVAIRLDATQGLNFLVRPGDNIDVVISEEVAVLQETADSIAARQENPDLPPRFEEVSGQEGARTVKAVLQDKRVLYVSATNITAPPTPEEEEGGEPPAATPEIASIVLIFAGTDQDAELLRFVQADHSELCSERQTDVPGCISVTLRHAEDDAVEETTGVTIDILFEQYGMHVPGIVEQLNEEVQDQP